jgi:ABC-type dipeptide/oligopeptide/nickel transport system permease subunit
VIFSVNLGWFPLGFSIPIGKTAADVTFLDALHHVTLPALTLSVVSIANVAMHTREKTIDIMQSDYFKFAIARGMSRTQALLRHGLRNIALPAITLQFTSISEIFGGSVLIEQVFSYPGLGQAAVTAGLGGDAPLLVGIAIVSALIVFCGNLTANILYAIIDPRLRPQRKLARSQLNSLGNLSGNSTADAGVEEGCAASDGTPTAAAEFPANALQSKSTGEAAPVTFHAPQIGRVSGRKRALVIAVVCAIVLIAVFVAGALLQTQAMQTDLAIKHLAPSLAHPFGTDQLGRDMLVRTLAGLSTSIGLGLVAALVSSIIALVLGTLAALGPKWIDGLVTFCIDLMLSIPHIVLLILISYALGRGFWGVAVGIALTHWASLSRIVRAEVMQTRRAPFIAHARRLGARPLQIARRHILPAVLPQFIVGVILMFPHAILHEASITFLGFGLSTETPAIGVILSDAMSFLSIGEWWLAVLPGLALLAVVMLFDAIGQSLRTLTTPASTQL